jgi:hypothetical protein
MMSRRLTGVVAAVLALAVTACGPPQEPIRDLDPATKQPTGRVFGGVQGLLGGGDGPGEDGAGATGIGVNSYLWRASLDTISFMPLASADPFGGVIITDWYSPPESPAERFKVNLYILDRQLRANGLRAAVFRQVKRNDEWVDAKVDEQTATELENAVLSRAREMRVAGR